MLLCAYFGGILFLLFFLIKYRNELLSLKFDRLGSKFGDENDIAIFNSFCLSLSIYYFLFSKNLFIKISTFLLGSLFLLVSFSSGSKIALFVLVIIVIYLIFIKNGKKRIWLSFVEILIIAALGFVILSLPFAKTLKDRLISFLQFVSVKNDYSIDYSTLDRINMFCSGVELFLRKPLFGYGPNGFNIRGGFGDCWSHNHFSDLLCNTGLIGFLLFHFPFYISFISLKDKKTQNKSLYFMCILIFLILMISVVLIMEKIYSFIAGVVFAGLAYDKTKTVVNIKFGGNLK